MHSKLLQITDYIQESKQRQTLSFFKIASPENLHLVLFVKDFAMNPIMMIK